MLLALPPRTTSGAWRTVKTALEGDRRRMSIEAVQWVLKDAPSLPAQLVGVLTGLAWHAEKDGRNAYPGQPALAEIARKSERQVHYDMAKLLELGLIRQGDQSAVAKYPAHRRPVVYDLAMERSRADEVQPTALHETTRTCEVQPTAPPETSCTSQSDDQHEQATGTADSRGAMDSTGCNTTSNGVQPIAYKRSLKGFEVTGARDAATDVTILGCSLLDEHLTHYDHRPPTDVIRRTGDKIDALLGDGFSADQIRSGLELMRARGKGPGLLPDILNEAVNPGRSSRASPPKDHRQQAREGIFERSARRIAAREEGTQ